jgi:dienelactone hydrolase
MLLIKPSRIKNSFITYDSPKGGGTIKDFLSQPTATKESTGIIVVHENRGLNPEDDMTQSSRRWYHLWHLMLCRH